MSDIRAEVLEWISMMERHQRQGGVWQAYGLALAALRAEAEYHEPFQEMEGGACDACEELWPCDAMRRLHSSLGLK